MDPTPLPGPGALPSGDGVPPPSPAHFSCAEGLAHGLTRGTLRSSCWHVPAHGARSRAAPRTYRDRLEGLQPVLPADAAFSCDSAAVLWGFPRPGPPDREVPVHVRREGRLRVRRPGVVAHAGLESRQVRELDGLRVVGPVDTWWDLAAPGHWALADLVVAGDHLVNRWTGDPALLEELLARRSGAPGCRVASQALALVRTASRSPAESLVRLWMLEEGLPEPLLNHPVRDRWGELVAEVDFLWEHARLVVEYDGEVHYVDLEARRRTLRRTEQLRDLGYTVITLTAADLRAAHRRVWLADLARRLGQER